MNNPLSEKFNKSIKTSNDSNCLIDEDFAYVIEEKNLSE